MADDFSQLKAYRDRLQDLVNHANQKAVENTIVPAANRLLATVKNRIQVEGKGSGGSDIGQYSTKPMYASKDEFIKKGAFKPGKKAFIATSQKLGKFNQKTNSFRGGKVTQRVEKEKMKTMYLPGGYKELRDIQGRPTDKVNATYSGDLMASYQQQVKNKEILQGLISEYEALKRKGLEARFGSFMKPMRAEIEQYEKEVTEGHFETTRKILRGSK